MKIHNIWSDQPPTKPRILFDFGNGSGAISFIPYEALFKKFFDYTVINNIDFSNPNHKCGAEYIQKHWTEINHEYFSAFDLCFFFDGDCDRVLCRVKGREQLWDGNSSLGLYLLVLMKMKEQLSGEIKDKLK